MPNTEVKSNVKFQTEQIVQCPNSLTINYDFCTNFNLNIHRGPLFPHENDTHPYA